MVASIFVNPLQFNDIDDLGRYPRTLSDDQQHLINRDCHLLFYPSVDEMYPDGQDNQSKVAVPVVSEGLCGASRPGHFDGVSTVVSKLFNMVMPDAAFFGEKDYQQLAVIRKMTKDLNMALDIVGVTTCREANGLAMSSRNNYLSAAERSQAGHIWQELNLVVDALKTGNKNFFDFTQQGKINLIKQGFEPDYFEIRHAHSLKPATASDQQLVVLVAALLGKARLIDNIRVDLSA